MANDVYKKAFDGLLETYTSLDGHAETIIRQLKRTPVGTRSKLIQELRNLETKQLELLDLMDELAKPT
jgi:hypothetical protein